jgi:cell filamentation protein
VARDPYVYPGTTVLRNALNVRDQDKLNQIEADVIAIRFLDLLKQGVPGELTPAWYRSVHQQLFQDLYPDWAGKFREMDISKANEIFYAKSTYLEDNAKTVFKKLGQANGLCDLDTPTFIERLSEVMGDLHVLHPFREGNTRTLQVATAEIARRAGHSIAWQQADPTTIRLAGTAAALGDEKPYREILSAVVDVPTEPLDDEMKAFKEHDVENALGIDDEGVNKEEDMTNDLFPGTDLDPEQD